MAALRGRPGLSQEIKDALTKIRRRHPNWSIRDIEKKFPEFFPHLKDKAPKRSSILNYFNNEEKVNLARIEESDIDKLWSIGRSFTYTGNIPINPEAVKRIIKIQQKANYPITIRKARWISYLSPSIEDDDKLNDISYCYAYLELIADLSGALKNKEFDTYEYDKYLVDESQQQEFINKFMTQLSDIDDNTATSILTTGQLTEPIKEVIFRDKKAYAIYQNSEIELGSQFLWLNSFKLKKFIPKDYFPSHGEPVKLSRAFLPARKQLMKLLKEGETK